MIFGRRKKAERQLDQLQVELDKSREELRAVQRQAERQAPQLAQLQKHLRENNFAARFVAAIDASRRRPA